MSAARGIRTALWLTACVAAATSCGSDAGTGPQPSASSRVASIVFERTIDSVEVDRTSSLTPVFRDANQNQIANGLVTATWSVADTTIASVSSTGVVTGIHAGATTLTIALNGVTSTLAIVVTPPRIAKITFAITSFTMTEGDTLTLPVPTLIDRTGAVVTGRTPQYQIHSANLSVSTTGVVTALAAGSGFVTVTLDTASAGLTFTVLPAAISAVKLIPGVLDMGVGHSIATQASALSTHGLLLRGRTYTYTVDNTAVASVTSTGIVTGRAPGKATLTVTTGTTSVNIPISVATLAVGAFTIDVRFLGNVSSTVRQAALQAAQRWETVISAPLIPYHIITAANDCGAGIPAVDTTETNMIIFVQSDSIDQRGNTVGEGGPCVIRDDAPQLTALGTVTVDSADVAALAQQGILVDMLTHEMGHILGIGTLWSDGTVRDSVTYFPNTAAGLGGTNPVFIGFDARVASAKLGFTADSSLGVPIENTGGAGTRDAHWRATVFGHELMTGTLHSGLNPLSLVTIEALADFGYTVVPEAADDLSALNAASPGSAVQPSLDVNVPIHGAAQSAGVQIQERLRFPRFTVSRNGKLHPIRGPGVPAAPR